MAKKFVRGVTGIEDIESYDKTLTNVNDILSDGQDTYVHTKKGKTESYYKLTDSLKSITSDNSELITVTKDDTTNTATLHPKHDNAKEQTLESTRGTVTIQHAENGSSATTKVDTNQQKVLEHDNLIAGTYLTKTHVDGENKTTLKVSDDFVGIVNGKQNQLSTNTSIGVLSDNTLRQLFYYKKTYTLPGGILKTHVKSLAQNTNVNTQQDEFNFNLRINQGQSSLTFNLNEADTTFFRSVLGSSNKANMSGCILTLSNSNLTVSTTNNTDQNYIITFSDII